MAKSKSSSPKSPFARLFDFIASFGLATVVMLFLLLITYLGTHDQTSNGLFLAQKKYFDSLALIHQQNIGGIFGIPLLGTFPLPLPGGMLLMGILFLNMTCGAIIRVRKNWRGIGMVITHFSILFLLIAGFVSFKFKREGNMRLFEGQTSDQFQSYHDWVIEIDEIPASAGATGDNGDAAPARQILVIPTEDFADLDGSKKRVFHHPDLPFELTLSGFASHSRIEPDAGGTDTFRIQKLPREKENERNFAAVEARTTSPDGSEITSGILWGIDRAPLTFETGGRTFALDLTRRTWTAPFTVTLDNFTRELHPGTDKPRVFMSDITKTQEGLGERIKISMNEPLRQDGYTFFQASWGPPDARPGEPLYSVFAVVDNPSDQWPLYACIMSGVGLLIHFLIKLFSHLRRQTRLAARNATS